MQPRDEPQGNQVFCQMNECIPEVVKAMRALHQGDWRWQAVLGQHHRGMIQPR